MRFLTMAETREYASELGYLDAAGTPLLPSNERHHYRGAIPGAVCRLNWFCRHLEGALQPNKGCLLWLSQWGVWENSENLHLYYRLRQSYHDHRLMVDAPGHLFLDYERADLISFLAVGVASGWDMHVLPVAGYSRAWLSHEGIVEFCANGDDAQIVAGFAAPLVDLKLTPARLT